VARLVGRNGTRPATLLRWRYLVALGIVLTACSSSGGSGSAGSSSESNKEGGKQKIAGLTANFHGTKDVTGVTSLELEADNFYFEPTVIKGTPGQRLTLTIKNESSGTEHNFSVESQHINKDLEGGKTYTVSVTLPQSGTISFFCEYHRSVGMNGGLQVS
jgi:plastocyanin